MDIKYIILYSHDNRECKKKLFSGGFYINLEEENVDPFKRRWQTTTNKFLKAVIKSVDIKDSGRDNLKMVCRKVLFMWCIANF